MLVAVDADVGFDMTTRSSVMPAGTGMGVDPTYDRLVALVAMFRLFVDENPTKCWLVLVFDDPAKVDEEHEHRKRGFIGELKIISPIVTQ